MKSSNVEYSDAVEGLDQFGTVLCSLITELLQQAEIPVQNVAYRVKSPESVSKKITLNQDKDYGVGSLTDLLGVRVITYFPVDVDKVASIVRGEFKIDESSSVDKRKLLEADRFGYLSLHVIASLTSPRAKLAEYKRFAEIKFEVQIRSVLQHAWAEIEHDLGYKTEEALPDEMRRSFSRLAGLLELADEEFERIRNDLGEYEKHVKQTITSTPRNLSINQSTLIAALKKEKILQELDRIVAEAGDAQLAPKLNPTYLGRRVNDLKAVGITNLEELIEAAEHYKTYIQSFATYWFKRNGTVSVRHTSFSRGIGLFYLDYVLAAQNKSIDLKRWRRYMGIDIPTHLREIATIWEKVINDLGEPKF